MHRDNLTRAVPLTIAQAAYLACQPINPHYKNIAHLYTAQAPLDRALLQRAMRYVQMQHEALRLRFIQDETGWHQYVTNSYDEIPLTYLDLSSYPTTEQKRVLARTLTELQASFNLCEGPVWRVVLIDRDAPQASRLLLLIHHLVVDGFSFPIVAADLQTVYQQIRDERPVRLSPVPTSFSSYARQLMEYAQEASFKQDCTYWLNQPWNEIARFPRDVPGEDNINRLADQQEISTCLSREETQTLLREVARAQNAQVLELLLFALVKTVAPWTGARALHLAVVMNGRNTHEMFAQTPLARLDVTRTVGYLPYGIDHLVLDPGESGTLKGELQAVQRQFRHVPHLGCSSQGLLHLCQDEAVIQNMSALPDYELLLNYHGVQSSQDLTSASLLSPVQEPVGTSQDPRNPRRCLLNCQVAIVDGQLTTWWEYNPRFHQRATIEKLIHAYEETWQTLIGTAG